jgi:hypothetical protein
MKVNAANENLFHVVSHLWFSKSLSSLVQLHQRLFKICRHIAQLKVGLAAVPRHCTMELQSCTDFIPTCSLYLQSVSQVIMCIKFPYISRNFSLNFFTLHVKKQ